MKSSSGITIRLPRWFLVSAAVVVMLWNVWGFSSLSSHHDFVASEVQLWRQSNISPQDWTVEDVDVWLGLKLQLDARERAIFRSNKVDGRLLLKLTEPEIRNDLRIGDNLMVKRVLLYLEDLKQGKGQGQAPMVSGQVLLRNVHQGNLSDFMMRMDESNTKPRTVQLYRFGLGVSHFAGEAPPTHGPLGSAPTGPSLVCRLARARSRHALFQGCFNAQSACSTRAQASAPPSARFRAPHLLTPI